MGCREKWMGCKKNCSFGFGFSLSHPLLHYPHPKMKTILSSETMDIPDNVTISVKAKLIEAEGPRGKLCRDFKHLNLDFQLIKDESGKRKLKVEAWFGSRKTSAAIRTALSHVENLITGVTKGYRTKMRFVYAHFPINASITNGNKGIEIRNFLGEKKAKSKGGKVVDLCLSLGNKEAKSKGGKVVELCLSLGNKEVQVRKTLELNRISPDIVQVV